MSAAAAMTPPLRRATVTVVLGVSLGLLVLLLAALPGEARAQDMDARPELPPLQGDARAYWAELVREASAQRLWEERFWHLLMHYRPDALGGGVTSEADGPGFFLSPEGKTDPRAELEATLAGLFSTETIPPADMTPQCTFPARYRWLNERLSFDPQRLPALPCERFEQWYGRIRADSVSLIFSSYFFNNPASMFGHTLLRFNREGRTEGTALLDSALNYAAFVPQGESDILYAIRGLLGGYRGFFSLLPYYIKVREYNDLENRDLWEYRLDYTPSQIDYMLRHTWEMGSTYYDYFFFDENCSYHLLSILEVGRPELHLRDDFSAWTLPTETVQLLLAQPHLVREVIYRPSQSSQMAQKLATMSDAEQDWVDRLIEEPQAADEPPFALLPRDRAALALDAAIDYYQYKLAGEKEGMQAEKARLRGLLVRRSRIPVSEAPPQSYPPQSVPPHEGHDSARVELAGGWSRPPAPPGAEKENQPFGEVTIQAAFHDLLSDDRAFAPNSQINLLHLRGRYEDEAREWRLERLALVDIISLFPLSRMSSLPSWKLDIGWQRNRDIGCEQCTPFGVNGGVGYALDSTLVGREVYFLLLDGSLEFDRELEQGHRAGFGLTAGIVLRPLPRWGIALIGSRVRYTEGQRSDVGRAALQQRFGLTRNLELSLEWSGVEDYREGRLGLGYYF